MGPQYNVDVHMFKCVLLIDTTSSLKVADEDLIIVLVFCVFKPGIILICINVVTNLNEYLLCLTSSLVIKI